jgi:catechol 2,3-dioxygenase-like lactoylglutathione lyase family enzyme
MNENSRSLRRESGGDPRKHTSKRLNGLATLNHVQKENHMSQTVSGFKQQKYEADVAKIATRLEVALIPVSDVDRAKEFYARLGWRLDDDIVMGSDFRVVQFTPPGSGCSISFGKGVTPAAPGSFRGGLIVSDIEVAHKEVVARGINASEVFHGSPFSPAGRISGPDPERQSYRSYVSFEDPDGNSWIVQEVTRRLPGRIDPATTTFASASDLASAIRRAAAAHGENGRRDASWADRYAVYMAAEQVGAEPPK